jgi:pyridoxamine 5'-phosphate oxidase
MSVHELPQLDETSLPVDPLPLFARWLMDAEIHQLPEPAAMALATATPSAAPSARMVLLRGFDERGFVFYTNYHSRKASELDRNPRAAAVLYWASLQRQIRIEGTVTKIDASESDAYFAKRPRGHRLGAIASPQSQVIPNRAFLELRMAEAIAQHPEGDVPRPEHWGGYRIEPFVIEFWQGSENRLHDRIRYSLTRGAWKIERLAP